MAVLVIAVAAVVSLLFACCVWLGSVVCHSLIRKWTGEWPGAYCTACKAEAGRRAERCRSCGCDFGTQPARPGPVLPLGEWIIRRRLSVVVFGFIVLVLWSMTLSTGQRLYPRQRRTLCRGNMKQIALALSMYADDNEGELPPTLYGLVGEGYLDAARVYLCPGDGKRSRESRRRRQNLTNSPRSASEFYTDYWYDEPARPLPEVPPDTVVLMDKKGNHRGCGNVVLAGDLIEFGRRGGPAREVVGMKWEELVEKYQEADSSE